MDNQISTLDNRAKIGLWKKKKGLNNGKPKLVHDNSTWDNEKNNIGHLKCNIGGWKTDIEQTDIRHLKIFIDINIDNINIDASTKSSGTNIKDSEGVVWKNFPLGGPEDTPTYPRASLKPPKEAGML